jgi:hypothetical protein
MCHDIEGLEDLNQEGQYCIGSDSAKKMINNIPKLQMNRYDGLQNPLHRYRHLKGMNKEAYLAAELRPDAIDDESTST